MILHKACHQCLFLRCSGILLFQILSSTFFFNSFCNIHLHHRVSLFCSCFYFLVPSSSIVIPLISLSVSFWESFCIAVLPEQSSEVTCGTVRHAIKASLCELCVSLFLSEVDRTLQDTRWHFRTPPFLFFLRTTKPGKKNLKDWWWILHDTSAAFPICFLNSTSCLL